ncbi:Peptide chain release factor 1 [Candidatus Providencia siddallii]|uniref:Peptide chain release factor 1 n=1 Tax=Candidatus Providencia siddallii TaxID=1715285 RepID=A0A0M6W9Q5_9GAMM|nr:Peptide chain release factor 1 [Candidatus Providencia siddallii]
MKHSIFIKLKSLKKRYKEIEKELSDVKIVDNQARFRNLSKEYSQLSNIVKYFDSWCSIQEDIKTAEIMLNDPELKIMAQEELKEAKVFNEKLEEKLYALLSPKDVYDEYNCFVEIRAGSGGSEAAIFVGDLFRMYSRFAENNRWHVDMISSQCSEYGGFKEIITRFSGIGVYGFLKFESGGHRVQRIPETESQGRIHTSTCTVAILPEIPEIELPEINQSDLRIDTFKSSGAGGQHVNTTDSAIRITHIPTGIIVECQDERSQHKNKAKAMSVLFARIHQAERNKRRTAEAYERRNLLGSGNRSDRIRTYNFPQGRVTDHRINLTLYSLDDIISGKLELLIEPIINEYRADKLAELSE